MIYNNEPKELFSDKKVEEYFKSKLNESIGSTYLRSVGVSNLTFTRYDGKLLYVEEQLKQTKESKMLAINFNTQFQNDVEINKTKASFRTQNIVYTDVELFEPTGFGYEIKIENVVVAEYFSKVNHLNILFDLNKYIETTKKQFNDNVATRTGYEFGLLVIKLIDNIKIFKKMEDFKERSWKNEEKRDENLKNLKEKSTLLIKNKIDTANSSIVYREKQIEESKRLITSNYKEIYANRLELEALAKGEEGLVNKIIKELDSISKNVYIKEVALSGTKFEFITNYLPIYDGDIVWEGNEYFVTIDMDSSSVKIESAIGKGFKGYWTTNDPHPHVNGSGGDPCLGSISSVISEMTGKYELYVLVVVMLEYLKAVNKDDSAGKRIVDSGRKKLTQKEVEKLTAYEREEEIVEKEIIEPIVKVKKEPKKKVKAEPVVETTIEEVRTVIETATHQDVTSLCVTCGVDVYTHGNYQAVMDIREGREDIAVACNGCVRSENGFVSHPSGFPAYVGLTTGENPYEEQTMTPYPPLPQYQGVRFTQPFVIDFDDEEEQIENDDEEEQIENDDEEEESGDNDEI